MFIDWDLIKKFPEIYLSFKKVNCTFIIFLGTVHLGNAFSKLPKGLIHLNLSHCGLTSKGVNQLAHALTLNKAMPSTLSYLNLSGNNLKEEMNVSSNLLRH